VDRNNLFLTWGRGKNLGLERQGRGILHAGGDTIGTSGARTSRTRGGNTSSASWKITRQTFASRAASLSTAAEAVVGEITRTGERSTNDVGREELAVLLLTAIEFPETFGGRAKIALFAGVDDAITTTGSEIQRRSGLGR